MKTTIDIAGNLVIKSETGLESYALIKWCNDNINAGNGQVRKSAKIAIYHSCDNENSETVNK